jgi:hypothetical protein
MRDDPRSDLNRPDRGWSGSTMAAIIAILAVLGILFIWAPWSGPRVANAPGTTVGSSTRPIPPAPPAAPAPTAPAAPTTR